MPGEARQLDYTIGEVSLFEDLDVDDNDGKLNWKLLEKYFQVDQIDQILQRHRNEFQTRTEHLQKRQDALHEREITFKERIISYELYIKVYQSVFSFGFYTNLIFKQELAMKHDRSIRRIEDEKMVRKNKQMEIDLLKHDIEKMQEEKSQLESIITQYQPHLNLLTQIVDRTDRFHSIDEMIEKFDMLYASYQDILMTMKTSNEELNNLQRQLLLTIEKKNSKISLMNNRIHELEQHLMEIQQRIEKIQTEIGSYQQILKEKLTENGAMTIAIESMFDLVKRYSHRSRRKEFYSNNQSLFEKLHRIDTFLSDLVYYVDYANNKQKKMKASERSIQGSSHQITEKMKNEDTNNHWRGSCETNQRTALIKDQSYFSYKVRGEDNVLYTIQMMNIDRKKPSQTRFSLTPNQSSVSMILRQTEKKNSSVTKSSTSKFERSTDKIPFSTSNRTSILRNDN